jgi:hypothetical protein
VVLLLATKLFEGLKHENITISDVSYNAEEIYISGNMHTNG